MILELDRAWIVLGNELLAWSPFGYLETRPMPAPKLVPVLTPPSLIDVIRAGYEPAVHPTETLRQRTEAGS